MSYKIKVVNFGSREEYYNVKSLAKLFLKTVLVKIFLCVDCDDGTIIKESDKYCSKCGGEIDWSNTLELSEFLKARAS